MSITVHQVNVDAIGARMGAEQCGKSRVLRTCSRTWSLRDSRVETILLSSITEEMVAWTQEETDSLLAFIAEKYNTSVRNPHMAVKHDVKWDEVPSLALYLKLRSLLRIAGYERNLHVSRCTV